MSVLTRGRALAALLPLALGASLAAMPTAQAATAMPSTIWVNCTNATVHQGGNQYYAEIACSPVQAKSWEFALECTNGIWYYSGFFTVFQDVSLYCPAGSTPYQYTIYYTT